MVIGTHRGLQGFTPTAGVLSLSCLLRGGATAVVLCTERVHKARARRPVVRGGRWGFGPGEKCVSL